MHFLVTLSTTLDERPKLNTKDLFVIVDSLIGPSEVSENLEKSHDSLKS